MEKVKEFFKWLKTKLMISTNGMAIGLFGTLIFGTILDLFGKIPHLEVISSISTVIKGLMGAGIGLGVALALEKKGVTVVASMASGMIGSYAFSFTDGLYSISDPLSCFFSTIICLIMISLILRKKTPIDLLLIPIVGIGFAILYTIFLSRYVHYITIGISELIRISFDAIPIIMCIIVSVLVGMSLTAPISSVAICVAISIGGVPLASMAALIGCSVQMVGFAVESVRDNKIGSVIAIGIGTSMLQFKNIIKKPIIWLPTIIVSAIMSPLAFLLYNYLDLENYSIASLSVGAGMGTSGLVGPINYLDSCNYNYMAIIFSIVFLIIVPIILVFLVDLLFRKLKLIEKDDFSLKEDI